LKQGKDNKDSLVEMADKTGGAASSEWRLDQFFPQLSTDTRGLLKAYHTELCKFNKVLNLVSPKSLAHADIIHFADSILSYELVSKNINKNNILYDLGSGNGFPGMVYGILDPAQKIALVDVDQRKCEFLKHVVSTLKLSNVFVENKNIEKLPENSIQQAVMRGFAPLPRAMLILRKIVSKGGTMLHLKSDEWSLEVSQVPSQLCSIWQPVLAGEYTLPLVNTKLFVVKTDKLS
jgi:16S rRNA (guanine527-N7)-methyltransferase